MSRVSARNQIVIPLAALRAAGLAPGDRVEIIVRWPGRLEIVRSDDLVTELAGIFGDDVYPTGYLEELRRDWRDDARSAGRQN